MMKNNIVLIGMSGCGKTTIGKILAHQLGFDFYDMDDHIVCISAMTVTELFEKSEETFRDWESKICNQLSEKKRAIISTGGGVIKRSENIKKLKKQGMIIFIDRPIDDIAKDVDISSRPLLKQNPSNLYSLYQERYPIYEKSADIKVLNDGDLEVVINRIIDGIKVNSEENC